MRARIISMFVLAASLLVASQAWAQSDGSVTFGGQWWSQDNPEAKYTEYRDLSQGAFLQNYVMREARGEYAGALWGENALRADQANSFFLARGITWRVDGSFNQTPHLFSKVTRSPYTQLSPGVFVLPDSLQKLIQGKTARAGNAYLQDLLNGSPYIPIGIETNVASARLRMRPIKDWQFEVRGTNRQRSGTLAFGNPFGFTAIELPTPISQRTLDVDATGTYIHGPMRVMASAGVSDFKNNIPTVRFDNFKILTSTYATQTGVGQMAMWPDNRVLRGRVAFSAQLPYASTFTATIGVSRTEQTQDFAPMTVNPVIAAISGDSLKLESGNLGGKVLDIVQDYRLTGRPLPKLFGTLRFREEKADDQTPAFDLKYGFVNYDQAWSRTAVETEPWGHKNDVFGLDADYELTSQVDVSLLAEHRTREHPNREVLKDAENVFGGRLHVRPMSDFSLSGGYTYGQRTLDAFDVAAYEGAEWPTFRRFDVADRNQSKADASLSWAVGPKLDLSASGWWSKDEYPNSAYGLSSTDTKQGLGEATLHAMPNLDLTGGFGYGLIDGQQGSIENPNAGLSDTMSVAPWTADLKDKTVYGFLQAMWWPQPKKFQVSLDYTFTRDYQTFGFAHTIKRSAAGIIPANVASTTALDLPSALYRTHDVTLEGRWHYAKSLEFAASYGFTVYDVIDPQAQRIPLLNVNPTNYGTAGETAATAIFLGDQTLSYKAQRVQVSATRRF